MLLHLAQEFLDQMVCHAVSDFPSECCGILIGSIEGGAGFVEEVVSAANITDGDPARSYQVDWRSLFHAVRSAREGERQIVGFYHSHPDGSSGLSAIDHQLAWRNYFYVVLSLRLEVSQEASAWHFTGEAAQAQRCEIVTTLPRED